MPPQAENVCKWVDQQSALSTFATYEGATQSQLHIKPLHWYVACRLVLECVTRPLIGPISPPGGGAASGRVKSPPAV
jgi:hypothetical protein